MLMNRGAVKGGSTLAFEGRRLCGVRLLYLATRREDVGGRFLG